MKIETLVLGLLKVNCYLLLTRDAAIVIDPGKYDERQKQFLSQNADKKRLILITHAHFDHVLGAERLRNETGVDIAIGEIEAPALKDKHLNLTDRFPATANPIDADILLKDNQIFNLGNTEIMCKLVPGHTLGSLCYIIEGKLFSGDTIFYNTIGNTEFPGGDFNTLVASIKKLTNNLPDDTEVYSGHGEVTTVGFEKAYNPFLRSL